MVGGQGDGRGVVEWVAYAGAAPLASVEDLVKVYSNLFTVNNLYLWAMKIKENILTLLLANGPMSVHDLAAALSVSRQYIHSVFII